MPDAPAEPPVAFFAAEGDGFRPLPTAASRWSADMVTGPAVCGIVARALESDHGEPGFRPARLTVDLFRAVRADLLHVATRRVRDGNRIRVADADVIQAGEVVARASLVLLRTSEAPPGEVWQGGHRLAGPSDEVRAAAGGLVAPWFGSGEDGPNWTSSMADHEGAGRKRMWTRMPQVVAGEDATPFARAAMTGETTSLMTNWGTAGVGFINADVTVALARLPVGDEVGVEADGHLTAEGIAVGTATLYDQDGPIGSSIVTAIANARRQVDVARTRALGS